MAVYRKIDREDILVNMVVLKPYIYYISSSEDLYSMTGSINLRPLSPLDKVYIGWEGGNIQAEKVKHNLTGSIQLIKIALTGSLDNQKYRTIVTLLDYHHTLDNNFAPFSASV